MILKITDYLNGEVNAIQYKKVDLEELTTEIEATEKTYNDPLTQSKYQQYEIEYCDNKLIVYKLNDVDKEYYEIVEVVSLDNDLDESKKFN